MENERIRLDAWNAAVDMVKPIIDEHGLEEYKTGAMFSSVSTMTKVDQHIDHTMRVANWLLGLDV